MLRNEVQRKTGLTRKAIEYYEEKNLIKPLRLDNGYRDYSENDIDLLKKISLYRKVGLNIEEIRKILSSKGEILANILREKEYKQEIDNKRVDLLKLLVNGSDDKTISDKLKQIEVEESIYDKLTRVFPGYFGQAIFLSYKPFLKDTLDPKQKGAYKNFVKYLDSLPEFSLSKSEVNYISSVSSNLNNEMIKNINKEKIKAVYNIENWMDENKEIILQYKEFKNSDIYKNSPMIQIQDKLRKFMNDNNFYEIAIPLIRKFSPSYDRYYKNMLDANERFIENHPNF